MVKNDLVEKLHNDHLNFARLLDALAASVTQIEAGTSSDFELVRDIMSYMVRYPDFQHHPVEDLMVSRAVGVAPQLVSMQERLRTEHAELAKSSERFRDILSYVVDGGLVEREDLVVRGREYIDTLRQHLNWEETDVFRAVADHLSGTDVAEIEAQCTLIEDPLFGPIRATEFAALWAYISMNLDE